MLNNRFSSFFACLSSGFLYRGPRTLGAEAGPQQPATSRWDRDRAPQAPQLGPSRPVQHAQPASQVPQRGLGATAQGAAPAGAASAGQQPEVQEILAALQKHRDSKKGRHKDKKSSRDGASQKRKRKGGRRSLEKMQLHYEMCTMKAMPKASCNLVLFRGDTVVSLLLLASQWIGCTFIASLCCCRLRQEAQEGEKVKAPQD